MLRHPHFGRDFFDKVAYYCSRHFQNPPPLKGDFLCLSLDELQRSLSARSGWFSAVAAVVIAFMFLMIILGGTDKRAPQGFAPIAIGLGLTLIHLISIPVTNTSVNPARSTGPALFVGGWAIKQLWLFWVAPCVGAVIAGLIYPMIAGEETKEEVAAKAAAA